MVRSKVVSYRIISEDSIEVFSICFFEVFIFDDFKVSYLSVINEEELYVGDSEGVIYF